MRGLLSILAESMKKDEGISVLEEENPIAAGAQFPYPVREMFYIGETYPSAICFKKTDTADCLNVLDSSILG